MKRRLPSPSPPPPATAAAAATADEKREGEHGKRAVLPKSEPKDAEPDGSLEQERKLGKALSEVGGLLESSSFVAAKGATSGVSVCVWRAGRAEVIEERGKHVKSMGLFLGSSDPAAAPATKRRWLEAEEALFLVELGAAIVRVPPAAEGGSGVPPEQFWKLCLGRQSEFLNADRYLVYSRLKRLGFVVMRHGSVVPKPPKEKKTRKKEKTRAPADVAREEEKKPWKRRGWWPEIGPEAWRNVPNAKVSRVVPFETRPQETNAGAKASRLQIAFDVWRPGFQDKFRRTSVPHFHLIVSSGSSAGCAPLPSEIGPLITETFPVPLKIAVCGSGGDISFFTLSCTIGFG